MKRGILSLVFVLSNFCVFGQEYLNYSNESLKISSVFFPHEKLNLHLPETYLSSSPNVKYPILIILDSQHEMTYPQVINSIDLLTSEAQMPEQIIVGIPFELRSRYYYTSAKKRENEKISGIEKTEKFIFEELIPELKKNYKASDYIQIVGHSRTGFLVNYLIMKRSHKIDVAVSLSGFYNNPPVSVTKFQDYISNDQNFKKELDYYFYAGNTLEESTYLQQFQKVNNYILNNRIAPNFKPHFSTVGNANHMTNFWVSIPLIFTQHYAKYNDILNNWFDDKSTSGGIRKTFLELNTTFGEYMNPSITQLFSIASDYLFSKKSVEQAIKTLEYGLEFYPGYADFHLSLMDYYSRISKKDKVSHHKNKYIELVKKNSELTSEEKKSLLANIE